MSKYKQQKQSKPLLAYRKTYFGRLRLKMIRLISRTDVYVYIPLLTDEAYAFRYIKRLIHKGYKVHLFQSKQI